MLRTSTGILAEIADQKKLEVVALRPHMAELERLAYNRTSTPRPFAEALRKSSPAIIAEIKRASPSRGLLHANLIPATTACSYAEGGASCLSVLTDQFFFQGSWEDLHSARQAVSLPILRKDFTIDALQIFEAAAHQADAILLIAAILTTSQLEAFRELASSLGLAALVEVHNGDELNKAVDSGAQIIGVNNRDLNTFQVSLQTSIDLAPHIPGSVIKVTESGIFTRADVQLLAQAGYHAFLIGESLMKSASPADALRSLLGRA